MRSFSLPLVAIGLALSQTAAADSRAAISVSSQQQERLGIVSQQIARAEDVVLVEMVGRVKRAPSAVRAAVASFSGAITKLHVVPGAIVKVGDPLVSMSSRDFAATASLHAQALAEVRAAETALQRQKELLAGGLVTKGSVEEARSRAERARAIVAESSALAPTFAKQANGTGGYILHAPVAGRVGAFVAQVGDTVEAMTTLTSITTTKDMWIELQMPQQLIGSISIGDLIEFSGGARGKITSLTDVIDPTTRTALAYATLSSTSPVFEGQLMRGQLVQEKGDLPLLRTPARSIVQIDGVDHVFRRTPDGFAPTTVQVVGRTEEVATINGDLRPGDLVATSGLTELKALAMQGIN